MDYQLKPLVQRAKAGDENAVEEILERLKPLILASSSKCYRMDMDASDFYQEAVIEIINGIRDFDEERGVPFLAYIKKRIFYRLKNLTRKKGANILSLDQPIGEDGGMFTLADVIADTCPSPEDIAQAEDQSQRLRMAMAALTPKQRRVLNEHYINGISMADIAKSEGLHYQAVVKLKDRAIKNMRIFMQDEV